MRWTVVSMLVLAAALARADGDINWDGTYERANSGGYSFCPDATAPVVVSGGKFSIPWSVKLPKTYRIGTIEGSVRPSGMATFKATLSEPMPADAKAALDADGYKLEDLQQVAAEMKLQFSSHDGRELSLSSGMCYASWTSAAKAKKESPSVKSPPPVAAGSPAWDTSYKVTSHSGDKWWCPKADGFGKIVVTKGRVSLPWRVETERYSDVSIGQIDGTIAANGSVKLRPWNPESELPPELVEGRPAKEATLAFVNAVAPKMTFSIRSGARVAALAFGKACEYSFASGDAVVEEKPTPTWTPPKTSTTSSTSSSKSSSKGSSPPPSTSSKTASPPPPPPAPKKGRGNGAECSYGSDCASGQCSFGKCVSGGSGKAIGNGLACGYSSDCASGQCLYGKCESRGSKKDLASGAACGYGSDCASGQCSYGKCE